VAETSHNLIIKSTKLFIMKNLKKISRSQMKILNGGGLTCSEACCPPPGIKRCPNIYCYAPCPVES
jgi:hypothetical protein